MSGNQNNYLLQNLLQDFGLNPVHNENDELIIRSVEVEEVFGKRLIWMDINNLSCAEKFRKSNYFNNNEFPFPGYPPEEYSYFMNFNMTITGLIFLVKDYPGSVAQRFMIKFLTAVAKQNLLIKNEEFILYRASQILLERTNSKTRRLIG